MPSKVKAQGLFDSKIIASASIDALRKLDPRALAKNSVIFVTEGGVADGDLVVHSQPCDLQRDGLLLGPDRLPARSSTQDPETGSRRLYAGRRLDRQQASSRLIPAQLHSPVSTSSNSFRHLYGGSRVFAFLSPT